MFCVGIGPRLSMRPALRIALHLCDKPLKSLHRLLAATILLAQAHAMNRTSKGESAVKGEQFSSGRCRIQACKLLRGVLREREKFDGAGP